MGGKASKEQQPPLPKELDALSGLLAEEDMASCLATISDLAHTGTETTIPEIRVNHQLLEGPFKPDMIRTLRKKLRTRLQRQIHHNREEAQSEHLQKQLHLLDSMDIQDEHSPDWASMRSWLVWCMNTNLHGDDGADDSESRPTSGSELTISRSGISRQLSVDHSRSKFGHQSSLSFDSDRGGKFSGQSSFDSCGATGET